MNLPEPIAQPALSVGKPTRTREFHYQVPGAPHRIVLVSISHYPRSKMFLATATPASIGGDGAASYLPFDGVRVVTEQVARYSDKARDAFVAKTLADLPQHIEQNAKLAGIFEPITGVPDFDPLTPEQLAEQGEDPAGAIAYVVDRPIQGAGGTLVLPVCSCGESFWSGYARRDFMEDRAAKHLRDKHAGALATYEAVKTGDLDALQPDFLTTV